MLVVSRSRDLSAETLVQLPEGDSIAGCPDDRVREVCHCPLLHSANQRIVGVLAFSAAAQKDILHPELRMLVSRPLWRH